MPLPKPRKGEKKSAFVSRCIAAEKRSGTDKSDDQIFAMCGDAYDRANEDHRDEDQHKHVVEEVTFEAATFKDETQSVYNVCLLAPESKNGYRYLSNAMMNAVDKYVGAQVFIGHPTEEENRTGRRDPFKLAGKVESARYEDGKIKGTIVTLPDEFGRKFYNAAKVMPESIGCSHVADIHMEYNTNGDPVVDEILQVLSVDLVSRPATTKSMFEDSTKQKRDKAMNYEDVTIKGLKANRTDIVESLVSEGVKPVEAKLAEAEKKLKETEAKLDALTVETIHAKKLATVGKLIAESKLPKEADTEIFRKTLMAIESSGDEFVKDVKTLIEDRMTLVGGVKDMGSGRQEASEDKHRDPAEICSIMADDDE